MDKEVIENKILDFANNCKKEELSYVDKTSQKIKVTEVHSNGGISFKGYRDDRISPKVIKVYADELSKGGAVHTDDIGEIGNTRSAAEGLIAHHPNVAYFKQPKSGGKRAVKHIRWIDHVIHKPGDIIRRDDLGTKEAIEDVTGSDWIAPEWCTATEAARYLEENPSDREKIYNLLDESTRRSDWEQKVDLLRSILNGKASSLDADLEHARWYLNFSSGEYGSWDDYFSGTSPERGLAEEAILAGPAGEELCTMLGLNNPAGTSNELAGPETVDMFVSALRKTGMHVYKEEKRNPS